jgi:hypothetical protein
MRKFNPHLYLPDFTKPSSSIPWYLIDGIDPADIMVVYQPYGAANQAASYVNLINPGTYDAAPGTAPTWDATNGWKFNNATSQYLTTGYELSTDHSSTLIHFTNLSGSWKCLAGGTKKTGGSDFSLNTAQSASCYYFQWGSGGGLGTWAASGNIGIAGVNWVDYTSRCYVNGNFVGTVAINPPGTTYPLFIGALNSAGSPSSYCSVYITLLISFNILLTDEQMATVAAAMSAFAPPPSGPPS